MEELLDELLEKYDKELLYAFLEGSWLTRWTDNKESLSSVLTEDEHVKMTHDILVSLNKAGFNIVRKSNDT